MRHVHGDGAVRLESKGLAVDAAEAIAAMARPWFGLWETSTSPEVWPPLTMQQVAEAEWIDELPSDDEFVALAATYAWSTAIGGDGWQMRALGLLSRRRYADLRFMWSICFRGSALAHQWRLLLKHLLPKPSGEGERALGVVVAMIRLAARWLRRKVCEPWLSRQPYLGTAGTHDRTIDSAVWCFFCHL